jgi:hypothetical protein
MDGKHCGKYRSRGRGREEEFSWSEREKCFVRPADRKTGATVELTDNEAELERWLAPTTEQKFRAFSSGANRGAGSADPRDRERWNDFVLSGHGDGSTLDSHTLKR